MESGVLRRLILPALCLLSSAAAAATPPARFDWFDYRGADPVDATLRVFGGNGFHRDNNA